MLARPRGRLVAYGVAVLATGVTLVVRWLLWPVFGDAVPHMFFFPAVMLAAYYGGFGPGVLSTVLAALAANYFFTEPRYSLRINSLNAAVALPLFVLAGATISALTESLHRARRRILADERRQAAETLSQERYLLHTLMDNVPDDI